MFTSILLISAAALVSGEQKRVLLDFASTVTTTFGWQKGQKPTSEIELDIALHINNAAHLESTLLQISDPSSSRYGAWLSHDELNAIVAPSKETLSTVHAWIASSGARVVSVADSQDWIKVRGSADQIEALLATEFFEFSHVNAGPAKLVRALEPYSVPLSVAKHVAFVAPVHTFPPQFQSHVIAKKLAAKKRQSTDPALVPADLRARYNMSGFNDQAANTAAVAEFQSQFYTPSDLTSFFQQFVPGWIKYANKVTVQPPGSNDPSAPGVEASLDIEWIMGISPNVSTTFYASSTFDFWAGLTAWASLVASQRNPPLVISISYGDQSPASKPGASYEQRLSTEFQKLGAKGITIVFASGDTGDGCEVCLFDEPSFPATSPYVLSVGATRFIGGVKGGPEMAVNEFGSGGGFSWTFPQPSYQAAAVKAYLANNKNTLPWWFSFNANGRATPDVAALGIGFNVVNGQQNMLVGGTSASAPTVSAILVQLNAVRLKAGKPPLGFVNPWIYQTWAKDSNAFFDVTQGNNLQSCCFSGFECVPQYDPVTGVGSLNFKDLVKHL